MSSPANSSAAANAADAGAGMSSNASSTEGASGAMPKKQPEGNPAFRMMGLPRLRLPSRNWMIFWTITGSFASAVIYDKYQTRRAREKWCNLVSHIPDEHLSTKTMPRKMTIYLAAPPGDGLRIAREHFHNYVKPVLVAAAMDWDVVEGRKEGDVRFKTAERIRKKRKRSGEGEQQNEGEPEETQYTVEALREKSGTKDYDGVAGDLVVGRHTWKEYVRGLHEGWLGPVDGPKQVEDGTSAGELTQTHQDGRTSVGDAAVNTAAEAVTSDSSSEQQPQDASPTSDTTGDSEKPSDEKKDEEEKPKPRQPPPYIQPSEYPLATASSNTPDLLGPSIGIRMPHILGFRNTPIRIYRFLTRRNLADSIGRDVAAAVLASHRPYNSASLVDESSSSVNSSENTEQNKVLEYEEKDWWKTTFQPRKEHEESVWIEDMVLDDRIASRMRAFQLTAEDEDRAKRLGDGSEKVVKKGGTDDSG